jgi:two-component system LytT family response regulator
MTKLKAFIVEDEKHNREYLSSLLEENFRESIELIGASGSIIEAMESLKTYKADILFLDIELSDGQVFTLLNAIDHRQYKLIFVTGYSEHAIKAIKFSAVDYLLKPVITSEFIEAVNKAMDGHAQDNPLLNDMISRKQFDFADYLIINNQYAIEKIALGKISHLEADGVYTIIHHEHHKTVSSKPLGVYEDVLSTKVFNRCHKSYIVNKYYIKRVSKGRGLEITLHNGTVLPVAVRKKEEFSHWFKN